MLALKRKEKEREPEAPAALWRMPLTGPTAFVVFLGGYLAGKRP